MTSKRIVIVGGCALAFGVSFANTGLVLQAGTSVSHLTGDIAALTIDLARWSPQFHSGFYQVLTAALCFLLGATLSGALIHHPVLNIARPYGRSVIGIGLLFIASSLVIESRPVVGIGLAAFGCGFQNALATYYRGIVLRTTHLTGMFTDFGITLGMRLRGYEVPGWKIAVPGLLIGSFFTGGILAAATRFAGHDPIAYAGGAYCVAGIGWSVRKHGIRL